MLDIATTWKHRTLDAASHRYKRCVCVVAKHVLNQHLPLLTTSSLLTVSRLKEEKLRQNATDATLLRRYEGRCRGAFQHLTFNLSSGQRPKGKASANASGRRRNDEETWTGTGTISGGYVVRGYPVPSGNPGRLVRL